jgi:hypothetical protein
MQDIGPVMMSLELLKSDTGNTLGVFVPVLSVNRDVAW